MELDDVREHRGYRMAIGVGLVSYGLIHLVIAWLAAQIALGGKGDASQTGALTELAGNPPTQLRLIKQLLSANATESDLAAVQRRLGVESTAYERLEDAPVLGHGEPVGAIVAVGIRE